ncbi:sorting nexin-32 isoform X2 [Drosophila sulfurigaster albostrigata]|uniref:Sorting nexin n=1 Tax=Drosophila albomicans TaxID=7291 RepID=A0A6P8WSI6_DROAB|nr:sorting nexin-32 isoform X2 [Drosophila albomicans]XP_060652604.1 sorting nexin-32 isoform X2 [Drosophila nasuta]XP_062121315.1 sorting nexin-32 isoform X2 [Drosophila sulfurigaster albostrigata]
MMDGMDESSSPLANNGTMEISSPNPLAPTTTTNGSGTATSPDSSSSAPATPAALGENALHVEISDALSEKEKVKFTVHTRTTLPGFSKKDNNVVRQHEEFVWLHDRIEENEDYAGYIIPPCPPRPDFDASREKLQRLGEGEGNMTKEEFKKMKSELEAEYLATFKKTVAMHEVFLRRLASHPVFRIDNHLKVFLEYDQDLCAKPRKKMAIFGGFVKSLGKTTDEILLSATVRDVNDFFENELQFLTEYHGHLREAASRTEKMTQRHKDVGDSHQKISNALTQLSTTEKGNVETFVAKAAEVFERIKNLETRVASDQDLKLGDTLRYYQRDSDAAKALLIRRLRCLAAYETANRNLEKARSKNKDVHAAETAQAEACEKFESMSACGKEELIGFRNRRVAAFKKSLVELSELEIKHAKNQYDYLRQSLLALKEIA